MMKIREGFRMRKLGRDHIVVGEGLKTINFNKMIVLNETAAYLWESVFGREFTKENLAALLKEQYEVDDQTASRDAAAVADKWLELGLTQE